MEEKLKKLWTRRSERRLRRGWRCPDEAQLAAYADSQLGGAARASVEAHLADCDFCRAQVSFLVRAAEADEAPAVPAQLIARAQQLVPAQPSRTNLWDWR